MKIVLKALNVVIAFLSGAFLGFLITGIMVIVFAKTGLITNLSNKGIGFMFYAPAIILGLLGIIAELIKINNKVINYFQDSVLRKICIVLSVIIIIALSVFVQRRINDLFYGKYINFADSIIETINNYKNSKEGHVELKFKNELNVDHILICKGYDIDKEGILRSGLLDEKVIIEINSKNPKEDGLYMYLLKDSEIVAKKDMQGIHYMDGSFKLSKINKSFSISMQKNKDGKFIIVNIK